MAMSNTCLASLIGSRGRLAMTVSCHIPRPSASARDFKLRHYPLVRALCAEGRDAQDCSLLQRKSCVTGWRGCKPRIDVLSPENRAAHCLHTSVRCVTVRGNRRSLDFGGQNRAASARDDKSTRFTVMGEYSLLSTYLRLLLEFLHPLCPLASSPVLKFAACSWTFSSPKDTRKCTPPRWCRPTIPPCCSPTPA